MNQVPQSILTSFGPFVVLFFLLVEGAISFLRGDKIYSLKDTLTNISILAVGNLLARFVWGILAYAAYTWVYQYSFFKIELNSWWAWTLLVIISDFVWYWEHRAGHQLRILWAVHSVHHSSEKYNYSIALRLPWLGGLTRIPFLMPMALIGFSPWAVVTGYSIVFLYQIWVHTEYVGRIPGFEEIFNSPSHHRVHHASNLHYIDKNYGGIFIVWDRLFGTFKREEERPNYGILHPIDSHNPIVVNSRDLVDTLKAIRHAPSVHEGLKLGFGPPT